MMPRKLNSFLKLTLLLSLLFVSCILLIHSLIQKPYVQEYLLDRLSGALGCEISTGKVSLYLWGRIGIQARDLKVISQDGEETIEADRVTIFFSPTQLIRGRLVPIGASLIRPKIELDQHTFGSTGIEKPKDTRFSSFKSMSAFPSLSVDQATVHVRGWPYRLDGFYFEVFKIKKGNEESRLIVVFRGSLAKEQEKIFVKGRCVLDQTEGKEPIGDMTVELEDLPLKWIPFPEEISMKKGSASVLMKLKGTPKGIIRSRGKISFKDTSFSLVEDSRSKDYDLREIAVGYKLSYTKGNIKISSFDFKTPEFVLAAEIDLDINNISNPRLNLKVTSPFLPTEEFKQIIPTPLDRKSVV